MEGEASWQRFGAACGRKLSQLWMHKTADFCDFPM